MGVRFQLELRMTRRQKIATTIWCGTGTALFVVPSAVAPWANVSAQVAAAALGIPAAVSVVFWMVKSLVDQNDASQAGKDRTVELGERMVRAAQAERDRAERAATPPPRLRPQPVQYRVIDGEVVR